MTRRVLALMKYGALAASTRQRLLQYRPALAEAGFALEVSPLFGNDYLATIASRGARSLSVVGRSYARRLAAMAQVSKFDATFVHCEAFPYLPAGFERYVASRSRALIFDFDDAIFHQYDRHPNPVVRALLGRKLAPLLRRADVCICGNAYLEEYARRYSDRTVVIPTVVDADRYLVAPGARADARPVVGWIGSPSTYEQLRDVLRLLAENRDRLGVDLHVIGSGRKDGEMDGVRFSAWSEETEVADIAAMDVGIMPLPDEPWARGKCGYKLIQYMACGLPVVASPVGMNSSIVRHGANGFLANSPQEWIASVDALVKDADLRRRMGQEARETVLHRYSLEAQAPRFVAAFRRACAE